MNSNQRIACLAASAGLALGAPAAMAQISNGGFETADFFPFVFLDWEQIPFNSPPQVSQIDNTVDDPILVHSGQHSCKIFGQFNGGPNASLVFQSIAAVPGNRYDLSAWSLAYSGDPIVGVGVGFVSIEFYDGINPGALEITTHDVVDDTTLQDLFTEATFSATAPASATIAQIALGFFQLDNTVTGSVFYDDAELLDSGPQTGLINGSFDSYVPTPGFEPDQCCIPGWTRPCCNAFENRTFKRTGNAGLIMYGQFIAADNTTVVYQDLPVLPGELVEGKAWAGHVTGDLLAGSNSAFFAVEFRDAADQLLEITSLGVLDAASAPDVFHEGTVLATAPATAASARLQVGLFQGADDAPGAMYFDDMEMNYLGLNTGLVNPGFDSYIPGVDFQPDPTVPFPGWDLLGWNAGGSPPNIGQSLDSCSGAYAMYMFGQFPGDGSVNDSVALQEFDISAGEQATVGIEAQHLSTDPLGADNFLYLNIEWLDGADQVVGFATTEALNSSSPQDVCLPAEVTAALPAAAVKGRIAIIYQQANEGGGAALVDNVTVTLSPAVPACDGDVNGDGSTDVFDFADLAANFGAGPGATREMGDLDGDGFVNVFDFGILAADFGCTP